MSILAVAAMMVVAGLTLFASIYLRRFFFIEVPAVAAVRARAGQPAVVAVPAQPRHLRLFGLMLMALVVVCIGISLWRWWPFGGTATTAPTAPPAAAASATNAPGAVIQAIEATGDKDVYLEMLYGNGQSGRDLAGAKRAMAEKERAEAQKATAEAEERAARVRDALRRKAKEMQNMGACAAVKAEQEAERTAKHMEVVRQDAAAYYGGSISRYSAIHVAEAVAGTANARDLRSEAVRLTYKSRRMNVQLDLEEMQDAVPEVRVQQPRLSPPAAPAAKPSSRPESSQFRPRTPPTTPKTCVPTV